MRRAVEELEASLRWPDPASGPEFLLTELKWRGQDARATDPLRARAAGRGLTSLLAPLEKTLTVGEAGAHRDDGFGVTGRGRNTRQVDPHLAKRRESLLARPTPFAPREGAVGRGPPPPEGSRRHRSLKRRPSRDLLRGRGSRRAAARGEAATAGRCRRTAPEEERKKSSARSARPTVGPALVLLVVDGNTGQTAGAVNIDEALGLTAIITSSMARQGGGLRPIALERPPPVYFLGVARSWMTATSTRANSRPRCQLSLGLCRVT